MSKQSTSTAPAVLRSATGRFNDEHYVSVAPKPKFFESTRNIGYTNYEAIGDIVDNALDSDVGATRVWINVDKNYKYISISDNGSGMSYNELVDALHPGSEGREITNQDLGLFGCGLKLAANSIARRFTVITKHKDGDHYIGVYDLDKFLEIGKSVAPVAVCNDSEIESFNEMTNNAETGTVIYMDKIDRITNNSHHQFCNILGNHLSEIYRYIIDDSEDMQITINGKVLEPSDTMAIKTGDSSLFNSSVPNQIYNFKFKHEGEDIDLALKIRVYYIKNVSKERSKAAKRNIANQGFYILRNNRQIIKAKSLDLFTKHNEKNGFRAEIFLSGDQDKFFQVSLQKNEIIIPQGLRDKLKSLFDPIIRSIEANNKADKKGDSTKPEEEVKDACENTKTDINSKGTKIRPEGVMTDVEKKEKIKKTKTDEPEEKDKGTKKRDYPKGVKRKSVRIFDYGFESQGIKGDICRFVNQGNGVISVMLNTDHQFYSDVFLPSNDEVKSNLMKLLFSIGRSQEEMLKEEVDETRKEEISEMFESRFERMSRIFTKLC